MKKAHERFLEYVKYDTASDHFSKTAPSTAKQHELAKLLERELNELGLDNVRRTENCYVYGSLAASKGCEGLDAVGLIAHFDTSPDISGANVKARIVKDYDGGEIVLNTEKGISMSPARFPTLAEHIGDDLIVTDGTTLLGADDKAGIAEIMAAIETVIENKLPHREIWVGFTPDEEVGRGVDGFDLKGFGAKYAYTLDGGDTRKYAMETFNAASAEVRIVGENIHPGTAKGKMKNASLIAMGFVALLPENERPEKTEGYEGFYHLGSIVGSEEECVMRYILRDHDAKKLEHKKEVMQNAARAINAKYGEGTATADIKDSYRNMREVLDGRPEVVQRLVRAMKNAGIDSPIAEPVRGGTDGARLSFMGLACPNAPTGGYNYHGRYEYASIREMDIAVQIVLGLVAPD